MVHVRVMFGCTPRVVAARPVWWGGRTPAQHLRNPSPAPAASHPALAPVAALDPPAAATHVPCKRQARVSGQAALEALPVIVAASWLWAAAQALCLSCTPAMCWSGACLHTPGQNAVLPPTWWALELEKRDNYSLLHAQWRTSSPPLTKGRTHNWPPECSNPRKLPPLPGLPYSPPCGQLLIRPPKSPGGDDIPQHTCPRHARIIRLREAAPRAPHGPSLTAVEGQHMQGGGPPGACC